MAVSSIAMPKKSKVRGRDTDRPTVYKDSRTDVFFRCPLGIEAALEAKANPSIQLRPKIFDEFAVTDRVALVSGGNGGLGLEAAIALCETGARVVYCFDLPEEPSEVFVAAQDYVRKLENNSRLKYFSADVRDLISGNIVLPPPCIPGSPCGYIARTYHAQLPPSTTILQMHQSRRIRCEPRNDTAKLVGSSNSSKGAQA
ncbi:hypothetical protein PISMIDRAFT_7642 [Pisolithus microcarpus 441]|uniref:Unplaced genomic scaffold scaffold_9, whole genome shotgun sequence n=1 Tax=Pisolithus microcarpus 441 TaxID=765257 RepID=A0A0D0A7R0_9AGAM|nr:hypothetical protein PISMIDRAFT_7642 [Pisolithus microcarpus 441]